MEATVGTNHEIEQLQELVEHAGRHRNLRLKVLRADDGTLLVVISNRNAASSYPLESGWMNRFLRDLGEGLFG